jgi:hypothetical protein
MLSWAFLVINELYLIEEKRYSQDLLNEGNALGKLEDF